MEKNRKSSCSKRLPHLNARYFYVTDAVKQKKVEIVHCPTEVIIAIFSPSYYKEIYLEDFETLFLGRYPSVGYTDIRVCL